jgi:hypothetical protein
MVIFLTSMQLVIDTYIDYNQSISDALDDIFLAIFTLESIMKVIAFGFFVD